MTTLKRYTIEIERATNNTGIIRERHSINEYIYGPWCKYDDAINYNHAELKRRDEEIAELKKLLGEINVIEDDCGIVHLFTSVRVAEWLEIRNKLLGVPPGTMESK